jgi:hypothetical protein
MQTCVRIRVRSDLAGLLREYNTTYSNISLNRSILLRLPLSSEGWNRFGIGGIGLESVWIGFKLCTTYVCNLFGALLESLYMLKL